jgi:methylglyoxal reductase
MKYRFVKKLNKKISIIGLGTWSLSNENNPKYFYKKVSKKKIIEILKKSFDKGINFYDTSPAYGKSEKFIGEVFKKKREKIILSSKVGLDNFGNKKDFSVLSIEKQLHNSLKNLKTDYLDIVFFYNPEFNNYNFDKSFEYICEKKEKGIIKSIGVSFKSPNEINNMKKNFLIDFAQCNFNILDHRIYKKKTLNYLIKNDIHVIARTILGLGIFTELSYRDNFRFSKNDIRNNFSLKQIALWKKGIEEIKKYTKYRMSIEKIALKFCTSEKLIFSSLLGVSSIDELEKNLKIINLKELSPKIIKFIKNLNINNNFYTVK